MLKSIIKIFWVLTFRLLWISLLLPLCRWKGHPSLQQNIAEQVCVWIFVRVSIPLRLLINGSRKLAPVVCWHRIPWLLVGSRLIIYCTSLFIGGLVHSLKLVGPAFNITILLFITISCLLLPLERHFIWDVDLVNHLLWTCLRSQIWLRKHCIFLKDLPWIVFFWESKVSLNQLQEPILESLTFVILSLLLIQRRQNWFLVHI